MNPNDPAEPSSHRQAEACDSGEIASDSSVEKEIFDKLELLARMQDDANLIQELLDAYKSEHPGMLFAMCSAMNIWMSRRSKRRRIA